MTGTITAAEFEELYRSVAPQLFGYARRRTAADPEDLVAEVFAIGWRRRKDLPSAAMRRAWLFGVARTLLRAEIRTRGRTTAVDRLDDPLRHDAHAAPDPHTSTIVRAAIERLSARDRELIQLTEWERLSVAEVAVVLGVRPGAARVSLHRARRALAADLELQALVGGPAVGPGGVSPGPAARPRCRAPG